MIRAAPCCDRFHSRIIPYFLCPILVISALCGIAPLLDPQKLYASVTRIRANSVFGVFHVALLVATLYLLLPSDMVLSPKTQRRFSEILMRKLNDIQTVIS